MVDDGLMDRFGIDEVYGMHNAPGVPIGEIVTRPGPLQASADEFEIVVTGSAATRRNRTRRWTRRSSPRRSW
jgi:metal-dependent amidase/aminoacylase/carboxypeptidase family protein